MLGRLVRGLIAHHGFDVLAELAKVGRLVPEPLWGEAATERRDVLLRGTPCQETLAGEARQDRDSTRLCLRRAWHELRRTWHGLKQPMPEAILVVGSVHRSGG